MALSQDLTEGPIPGHLVRMTIPMFLGIASMIVASMSDTIFIGLLGATELAAYSFTFPLIMGLTSVSMGLGTGAASFIARAQGAGDRQRVCKLTTHALILTFLLVLLLAAAAFTWQQELFAMMGATDDILPLVVDYVTVYTIGLMFFTLPMVGSTILRSVGNARIPGYIMTTTSAIQMVLSPLLIFGLLGLPEWGFIGAAWAGVIAGLLRTAGMGWIMIRDEQLLLFTMDAFRGVWRSARDILYIGLPSMLSSLIGPFTFGVIIWLLAAHGPEVVAGFGITSRIEMLLQMILMSLSSSVGPFVGQNWGARKTERIYAGLKVAHRFCWFWGCCCFVLVAPFGEEIIALVNDDPLLVESAAWYLWIVPASIGVMGVGAVSASVFVALGKPLPGLVMSIARMAVVYIPLALLFNSWWGYIGVFVATAVSNLVMGVISYLWSHQVLKTEIRRQMPDATPHAS